MQQCPHTRHLLVGWYAAPRWADVRPLPGVRRLLEHLRACGCRVAIATSTSRATFDKKLSKKPWMRELFQAAVCGDEVRWTGGLLWLYLV